MISWILLGICFVALLVSLIYNYRFAIIIIKAEDSINESLDILDGRYENISKILSTPIFFDSPQVRQVLEDIETCRSAILVVANNIASIEEEKNGEN